MDKFQLFLRFLSEFTEGHAVVSRNIKNYLIKGNRDNKVWKILSILSDIEGWIILRD